jgi:FdhD protein
MKSVTTGKRSSFSTDITKVSGLLRESIADQLAIEEPLEISLNFKASVERITKNIAVTMRSPGHDEELATGFLFTESIINKDTLIDYVGPVPMACRVGRENKLLFVLGEKVIPNLQHAERNFYTSSSCGVCGKASIESVRTVSRQWNKQDTVPLTDSETICSLPEALRRHQLVFASTGGIHGCGLFHATGELIAIREDVGRHNALDKLIGMAYMDNLLPLGKHMLLLSGRASFELIQKAAMAGIKIVAAIGAPSSLAVELAEESGITLIGFLRGKNFNIYTGNQRIKTIAYETADKR